MAVRIVVDGKWMTWKTIRLGTGLKGASDFLEALEKSDCDVIMGSEEILRHQSFRVSRRERSVNLIVVSSNDLGLMGNNCYKDICCRAREVGLDLCPAEVGPQLCLQYKGHRNKTKVGRVLAVAMKAVTSSSGNPYIFGIERRGYGKRCLVAIPCPSDRLFPNSVRLVFQRRE